MTYAALNRLQMQLQANTTLVETNLGRGNHSYLALVLSDTDYASISKMLLLALLMCPLLLTAPTAAISI